MQLALKAMITVLLVLALGAGAVVWRVNVKRSALMERFPPEGQFVSVDGHPVHYVQRGNGPDLVLVHGASGNTRDFTFSLVDQLTDRFRVTVFDRPGLGHTPRLAPSGVTLNDQATLLAGAAEALGIERPILAGQSFGGAVVMAWAVARPGDVAAVVNIAGATYPWPGELDQLYARLAKPGIGHVMSYLAGAFLSDGYVQSQVAGAFAPQPEPQGYGDYIGASMVLRPESLRANAQQRTDLREHLRALSPRYSDLTMPIEIVHGDADDTVGLHIHSEPMARDVASARLTVLPGIGHMPHHVAEDQVVAAIDRAAARANGQAVSLD
jgi:pimeloyl-ACP methyl ester carboxylesterase